MCHSRVAECIWSALTAGTMDRITAWSKTPRTAAAAAISAWLLISLFAGAYGLEIKHLSVPTAVQAGSEELTLDCQYSYTPEEANGLVVKWYHETGSGDNRTNQQVYQWIVTQLPQDLGVLKGRLDTTYEVTNDTYTKHRALRISKPTVNLTGDYRCHVSSNDDDASLTQHMTVYTPPKDISISSTDPSAHTVNISCNVEGVYPFPTTQMTMIKGKKSGRVVVNDVVQIVITKDETYDIVLYKVFDKMLLSAETTFECTVSVPKTTYSTQKELIYRFQEGSVDTRDGNGHQPDSESNSRKNRNHDSSRSTASSRIDVPTVTNAASGQFSTRTWSIASVFVYLVFITRFLV